jgi:hypothetical protein
MAYRGGNLYLIVYHSRTLTLRILIRPFSSLASTQLQHIKHHRNRHMITPPSPPHSRISLNQLGKNSSPTPLHHDTYTRLGPGKKKNLKLYTPLIPPSKNIALKSVLFSMYPLSTLITGYLSISLRAIFISHINATSHVLNNESPKVHKL